MQRITSDTANTFQKRLPFRFFREAFDLPEEFCLPEALDLPEVFVLFGLFESK